MATKSLQRMAAPLVVSFTMRFLFTFVDLFYAGFLGKAAVAAIGLYVPINNVYIALWVGLSAGFTASLSNAFGHRDEQRIAALKRALLSIIAVVIPCLMLAGGGLWLVVPHLGLHDPELEDAFRTYATTLMIGMPLTGFWSILPDSIVKAHQDMRSTMVAGLLASFANVGLNTLFVLGFGWGVFGLAFATVLSRVIALGYAVHRAHRLEAARERYDAGSQRTWQPPIRAILVLSLPGATTYLLTALESGVANGVLANLPDATARIAAFTVFQQVLQFALMPAAASSVAVVPYLAHLLPTGDHARARRELRATVLTVLGIAGLVTIAAGWLFASPLAAFFLERDPGVSDDGTAAAALALLPFAAAAMVPFLILRPVFEAVQRPRAGILVSVLRFAVLAPPLLVLGAHYAPAIGLDPLRGLILGVVVAGTIASATVIRMAGRALAAGATG